MFPFVICNVAVTKGPLIYCMFSIAKCCLWQKSHFQMFNVEIVYIAHRDPVELGRFCRSDPTIKTLMESRFVITFQFKNCQIYRWVHGSHSPSPSTDFLYFLLQYLHCCEFMIVITCQRVMYCKNEYSFLLTVLTV